MMFWEREWGTCRIEMEMCFPPYDNDLPKLAARLAAQLVNERGEDAARQQRRTGTAEIIITGRHDFSRTILVWCYVSPYAAEEHALKTAELYIKHLKRQEDLSGMLRWWKKQDFPVPAPTNPTTPQESR